jgi:hypothetical protein
MKRTFAGRAQDKISCEEMAFKNKPVLEVLTSFTPSGREPPMLKK